MWEFGMPPGRLMALLIGALLMAAPATPACAEEGQGLLSWRSGGSLRQRDADAALHEALKLSIASAVRELSAPDSFAPGTPHRIGLPDSLTVLRGDWNAIGRSGALPRLEEAMNRAAIAVVGPAEPLLQQEAADVNFYDSVAMVKSGDQAASRFFALRARPAIEQRLKPVVEQALSGAGAFTTLAEAAAAAGQPGKAASYREPVVQRTLAGLLDALFTETGRFESEMRGAPQGRGSPVLERVFSNNPQTARAGG